MKGMENALLSLSGFYIINKASACWIEKEVLKLIKRTNIYYLSLTMTFDSQSIKKHVWATIEVLLVNWLFLAQGITNNCKILLF